MIRTTRRLRDDSGSAVVEFALVTPLLLIVVLAIVQVILALHVRTTLTAAAAEGARAAALAGSSLVEVLNDALGGQTATGISARYVSVGTSPAIQVQVTARLPLIGLLGPETLVVEGHALAERG